MRDSTVTLTQRVLRGSLRGDDDRLRVPYMRTQKHLLVCTVVSISISSSVDQVSLKKRARNASQGLPDMKRWNKITGMAYNKTKSKKKDELGDQARIILSALPPAPPYYSTLSPLVPSFVLSLLPCLLVVNPSVCVLLCFAVGLWPSLVEVG